MRTLKTIASLFSLLVVLTIAVSAQTSLTNLSGGTIDVQAQSDKVVILAVGATWLPLSAKQAEYTNALVNKYKGKDVVVYFVAIDANSPKSKNFATDEAISKFAAAYKLTIPVLRDPDGAVTLKKFDVDQVPSFVILDKQGKLVGTPFGGIDPKFDITVPISKAVDKLL